MRQIISKNIKTAAEYLLAMDDSLTKEDIMNLNQRSPLLVIKVKKNIDKKKKDPFDGISDKDKRLLLAFVVYKRQNITTEETDRPNDEDAAKILHGIVYPTEGTEKKNKKVMKDLEEDLKKQLEKAGLSING